MLPKVVEPTGIRFAFKPIPPKSQRLPLASVQPTAPYRPRSIAGGRRHPVAIDAH